MLGRLILDCGPRHWYWGQGLVCILSFSFLFLYLSSQFMSRGKESLRTGIEAGRSRQIPFPFTRNLSTEYIVKYAKKLWDEVCQPMRNGGSMKLNNVRIPFSRSFLSEIKADGRCHYHSLA
jgi:hypothetical protein